MGHPKYSTEEIVERGREIYETRLKKELEAQNIGKFLVIDIETGEYEMDEDRVTASLRASHKSPGRTRFGMRIGYETLGTIGNSLRRTELVHQVSFLP